MHGHVSLFTRESAAGETAVNVMGMGVMELGVVFLIAFLVLGPSRSIDMARSAGKLIGDLRKSFNDVMEAVNLEQEQE